MNKILLLSFLSILLVACGDGDNTQISTKGNNSEQEATANEGAKQRALHPCDLLTKEYIRSAFKGAINIVIKPSKYTDRFCQTSFELKEKTYGALLTFLVIGYADEAALEQVVFPFHDKTIIAGVGDKAYHSAGNYGQVFAFKEKNLIQVYVRIGSKTDKDTAAKIANDILEKLAKP
jgi:hypothetical protein